MSRTFSSISRALRSGDRAKSAHGGVYVTGYTQIDEMLAEVVPREIKKHLRRAARVAAKVVQAEARRRVRKRTGALQAAIKVRKLQGKKKDKVGASVIVGKGWFKGDTFYGAFLEFGHRLGKRPSRSKKKKASPDGRREIKPYPFMRPALYDNEQRVKEEFIQAIRDSLKAASRAPQAKLTGAHRRAGRRYMKQGALIRGLEDGSINLKPITIFDDDE